MREYRNSGIMKSKSVKGDKIKISGKSMTTVLECSKNVVSAFKAQNSNAENSKSSRFNEQ